MRTLSSRPQSPRVLFQKCATTLKGAVSNATQNDGFENEPILNTKTVKLMPAILLLLHTLGGWVFPTKTKSKRDKDADRIDPNTSRSSVVLKVPRVFWLPNLKSDIPYFQVRSHR